MKNLDPVVFRLWRDLVSEPNLPFLDTWLSRRVPEAKGLSHAQRLHVGARIRDAVKLQYWVALVAFAADQPQVPVNSLGKCFEAKCPDPHSLSAFLQGIAPRRFFEILAARNMKTPDSSLLSAVKRVRAATQVFPYLLAWEGVPLWHRPIIEHRVRLSSWSREEVQAFARRMLQPAPLWIRCNDP